MKFFDKDPLVETFMRLAENELYEAVTKEVMQEQIFSYGIWGRAFADVEGDMDKAKALYIKYRVQDLKDRAVMSQVQAERAREEAERERKAEDRIKIIATTEIAREVLSNLGHKYDFKIDGQIIVNDNVILNNAKEIFDYFEHLKKELSHDYLIKRLKLLQPTDIYKPTFGSKDKWEVRIDPQDRIGIDVFTFNSKAELRAYMIKVLFMEDD